VVDYKGPILDKIGQEIIPGCIIAYGHALGRCAGLRLGKVIKLSCRIKPAFANYPERREYRITVHGLDDDSYDTNEPNLTNWRGEKYQAKLLEKKSTLQFPSRVVVLNEKLLPEDFRKLLASVEI